MDGHQLVQGLGSSLLWSLHEKCGLIEGANRQDKRSLAFLLVINRA
jgi:hypothetical protein